MYMYMSSPSFRAGRVWWCRPCGGPGTTGRRALAQACALLPQSRGPEANCQLRCGMPQLPRRRLPRVSAPSVVHGGSRRDDGASLQKGLDRYRRQSVSSLYVPGSVVADADFIAGDDPGYEFPNWWFFVIPCQYYLEWMLGGCLWGIVWPHTISQVFGDNNKALVLGALGTMGTVIGFASPLVGSLSDRLPEYFPNFCARWGRRRPFIALGQGLNVLCLAACYHGVSTGNVVMMILGLQISNMTNQLSGPPFSAIVPETVPESQRGLCLAIQGWLCQVFILSCNGLGYFVGEGYIPAKAIWYSYFFATGISIPLACWACSGTACGPCSWEPERMPTEEQLREKKERLEKARLAREQAAARVKASAAARAGVTLKEGGGDKLKVGCCARLKAEFEEFTSALSHPPYRWLWLQGFVGCIGGIFQGCFLFFWFQDCFPDGYYFFHWKLTSSVQSAVSINGMTGSLISAAVSWSGNWWRDRVGGRQMILAAGCLGLALPFTYALIKPDFTIVLLWTIYNSIMGGFASASGGAIGPDVLPVDPLTRRPDNAARDGNLLGWANLVPNTILPMFLGNAMRWFPSHLAAYNTFWLIGGSISACGWLMYGLMIHPSSELPGRPWQCTRHWAWPQEDDPWYQPAEGEWPAGPLHLPTNVAAAEADLLRRRHWASKPGGAALWAPQFRRRLESSDRSHRSQAGLGALACDRLLFASAAMAARGRGNDGDAGHGHSSTEREPLIDPGI